MLTEFETAIKRAYLSTNFETTEEMLDSSALSGRVVCDSANLGSALQLPWIPQTTAAAALRLLELDGSISYSPSQKVELPDSNELEGLTKLQSTYAFMMNIEDIGKGKHRKEKNSTDLASMRDSYGYRQKGVFYRVHGRPQKRFIGSGRRNLSMSSIKVRRQQGQRTHRQRFGRGWRTVRRRIEKSAVPEMLLSHLGNTGGLKISDKLPRTSSGEEENGGGEEIQQMQIEDADNSNCLEAVKPDADDHIVEYEYEKLGTRNTMVMSDEDVDGSEDGNGFEEMREENFEVDADMNEDSDGNSDGNENGTAYISDSEEFSD